MTVEGVLSPGLSDVGAPVLSHYAQLTRGGCLSLPFGQEGGSTLSQSVLLPPQPAPQPSFLQCRVNVFRSAQALG